MRKNTYRQFLAGAACVVAAGGQASAVIAQNVGTAQTQTADLFARDRAVGVRERTRPDFEAVGARYRTFTIFPKIQTDIEFNNNVFASETDAQSDIIFRIRPEVSAESDWSRHAASGFVRGTLAQNADYSSESSSEGQIGATGRLDVVRGTNIAFGGDYGKFVEPRTASNTAVAATDPIEYTSGQVYVAGTRTIGRLRTSARADYRTFDYDNGRSAGGALILQDDRDREVSSLVGRVDYAFSPGTAVFGQITGNSRSYDATGAGNPARDSSGYEALAGLNFEVSAVSRGEIAVGYISQRFDEPVYGDIGGFGARGRIEWFPTDLTTVAVTAARTVEDAGIVGAAGYLRSEGSVTVDHELLRNVILSGRLSYSEDAYNGIDRSDSRLSASLGGTYLINRRFGLNLTALYLDQQSEGPARGPTYDVTRLLVSLVSQF